LNKDFQANLNNKERVVKKFLTVRTIDWGGLIPIAVIIGLFLISII